MLSRLEEEELGASEDGFGLVQSLYLLLEGSLADFEILHQEVARLVQIRLLVLQLLLLVQSRVPVLLRGCEIALGLGLLPGLVRDLTRLLLDRRIRVLHERLVGLLRVRLGLDRVGLELLRLADDLLDHAHDAASPRGLLVLLEARRRGRAGRLRGLGRAGLEEGLVVEALKLL